MISLKLPNLNFPVTGHASNVEIKRTCFVHHRFTAAAAQKNTVPKPLSRLNGSGGCPAASPGWREAKNNLPLVRNLKWLRILKSIPNKQLNKSPMPFGWSWRLNKISLTPPARTTIRARLLTRGNEKAQRDDERNRYSKDLLSSHKGFGLDSKREFGVLLSSHSGLLWATGTTQTVLA